MPNFMDMLTLLALAVAFGRFLWWVADEAGV
jgi:hypothetical protein